MSTASMTMTLLAAAVVVLGGLVALARAIWAAASDVRDNRIATQANTRAVDELSTKMDNRITSLEQRVASLETRP